MDLFIAIVIGVTVIFIIVIYLFDPLEKYDKNLDDPNYKRFDGAYRDLRLGSWPRVTGKRKNGEHDKQNIQSSHVHEKAEPVDEIKQFIAEHRLPLYRYVLFNRQGAVKFVYLLKKHKRKLYGFDGFHLLKDISPTQVQIDQAYSPDYSKDDLQAAHDKAVAFFEEHHEEDIGYEFVYDKDSSR